MFKPLIWAVILVEMESPAASSLAELTRSPEDNLANVVLSSLDDFIKLR
jgi:hypothetical protein